MAAIYERGAGRLNLKLNAGSDPVSGKMVVKTVGMPVAGAVTADNCAAVATAVVALLLHPALETQFVVSDTLGDDGI